MPHPSRPLALAALLAGALGLLALLACSSPASPGPPPTPAVVPVASYPLTIADGLGRTLTLAARAERIVSLSAGHTEALFAIGAGAQVVAVDLFSDYPAEAKQRPQVDAFQPSLEAIAALEPDLVLLTYDPGGLVEGLDRLRIPTYVLRVPSTVQGVMDGIRLLGLMTDHAGEAEAVVGAMQTRIEAVRARVRGAIPGPRVFHELDSNLYTVSERSFVGDLYALLGAQNIAKYAVQEYPQLTQEVVIQQDPQVIILADEAAGESPATVKARPGWAGVSAVREGRVYAVAPDLVSRPGPRVVEGLEALAALLYPDLFRGQRPAR